MVPVSFLNNMPFQSKHKKLLVFIHFGWLGKTSEQNCVTHEFLLSVPLQSDKKSPDKVWFVEIDSEHTAL